MAELHEVRGIGPATAALLADHGLGSVKKLARADLDTITAVPGFGAIRAEAVQAGARAVVPPKVAKEPKSPKAKAKAKPKKGAAKAAKIPKITKKASKIKKKTKKH